MGLCMEYQFGVGCVCVCEWVSSGCVCCRCYCDGSCAHFGAACFKGEDVRSCVTLPSYRRLDFFREWSESNELAQDRAIGRMEKTRYEFVVCSQKLILNRFPNAYIHRTQSNTRFLFFVREFASFGCLLMLRALVSKRKMTLRWILRIHFVCEYTHCGTGYAHRTINSAIFCSDCVCRLSCLSRFAKENDWKREMRKVFCERTRARIIQNRKL